MEARSNINGFSNRSQDWKSNTDILTEPETRIQLDLEMSEEEKVKVDIIELIDHHNIQKHEEIIDELDHKEEEIRQAIHQLKTEGVLQVTQK